MSVKGFSFVIRIYSDFSCTKLTSDPPQQHQDDQNQKNQSKSTAGIVSPALTVRPGRQCANQDDNQNNDQDSTHVLSPFLVFDSLVS